MATTPTTGTQVEPKQVSELSDLTAASTQLPGSYLLADIANPAYNPVNPGTTKRFLTRRVAYAVLVQQLQTLGAPTNGQRGMPKIVLYESSTAAGIGPNDPTLDRLPASVLCVGTEATVLLPVPHKLVLGKDPTGPLTVATTGSFLGPTTTARWMAESEVYAAGDTAFNPLTAEYAAGARVNYRIGGVLRLFSAATLLRRVDFPGNLIPTPGSTTDWEEVSPAGVAAPVYRAISVPVAQQLLGDDAVATIRYRILRGAAGDVELEGLAADADAGFNSAFAPTGYWQDPATGAWEWVAYDVATDTVSSTTYDDSQLRELITSLATARLAATATVLFANGEASEEFTSHAQAEAVATPGDLILLRGYHNQVVVNKPININAEGAVIDGLVATYLESGFSYKWRGGYFTKRIFTGRTVGVPHNVVFERITMGPNSYHQSHTNGTNSYGSAADQYTFIDSHLTHVLVNHYNGLSQFQSVFYERCSFVPTTPGAVWRGGFHPQSIVTALNCRFQPQHGDALFDTPAQGRFSLAGISTVPMTAGGVNLLSDGLRVVDVADPFNPPASPQQLYPAGDGTTPTPATGIDYANPVTLNAAATLSANRAYYATGAGYTLTLPDAAANLGKAIFLSIAATATGLYPITGAGSLALYAAESITFRATLDGWKKTGGELLQLTARIETALTQQDALLAPGYTTIPFSVTKEQNFPGLVDLPNAQLMVPRTSRYSLVATAAIKNAAVNGQYYFIIQATKADLTSSYLIANYAAIANNNWGTVALSTTAKLEAGTSLRMQVYTGENTGNLLGQYEGNQCTFTLTELI